MVFIGADITSPMTLIAGVTGGKSAQWNIM